MEITAKHKFVSNGLNEIFQLLHTPVPVTFALYLLDLNLCIRFIFKDKNVYQTENENI